MRRFRVVRHFRLLLRLLRLGRRRIGGDGDDSSCRSVGDSCDSETFGVFVRIGDEEDLVSGFDIESSHGKIECEFFSCGSCGVEHDFHSVVGVSSRHGGGN